MSKKDYVAVARLLAGVMAEHNHPALLGFDIHDGAAGAVETIANGMADIFAADSPNFRREQFLVACGVRS